MRKKWNNDIFLDLTSLLDIIFIILMIVVCSQLNLSKRTEEAQAEAAEAKQAAETAYALYSDQLTADSYTGTLSVTVSFNEEAITERTIRVLTKGGDIVTFDLIGNQTEEPLSAFTDYLQSYIDDHPGQPVILSFNEDDEDILYRDEKAIRNIFLTLSESPDVYLRQTAVSDDPAKEDAP
ncbi:MAG: hypothetical protein K6G83_00210 [Lachnospiraceae bacterium]|nr:hypothetical protein [Lachnospiraceae bacterium]